MSAIAAYAVETETAKELKKGQFKLYHQKTPPTNVVLLDIHESDTDDVKNIKRLINQMRLELGNSTDLIKIEPETALFNILYTKKEVDQLIVSTGSGFNLPLFLRSVLITGANLIKLRSDTGERVNAEHYPEYFNVTADNFEYVYLKLREYADKFANLDNTLNIFDGELDSLTKRVDELEEDVSKIESCECDKQWMRFMKQNFKEGFFDDEIIVDGSIDLQGKHAIQGLTEMTTHNGVLMINGSLYTNDKIQASNIPSQLTFRPNGVLNDENDGIVDYNTYGKWYQPCDIETFGSIDVDNRLRINTLDSNKTSVVKTVDVGATLDDFGERIDTLETGLSEAVYKGGDGIKVNDKTINVLVDNETIKIGNDNKLRASETVYKGGEGIVINDKTINVLVDNETITIDKDNKLHAIGGGTNGFWKLNPTHMQSLPEHSVLETYDFNASANKVTVKNIDNDTMFVYFPDLSVDLSYDRAQFIEIKSNNPTRTWYLSTKNNQMEFPMIINNDTLQEEMTYIPDLNHVGMLWRRQIITKSTTENGKIESMPLMYTVYWSKYSVAAEEIYLSGSPERPLTITIDEYNSSGQKYRSNAFILTTELREDMTINGVADSGSAVQLTCRIGGPMGGYDIVYYISGVDYTLTTSSKWTFTEYSSEIPVDELINRIKNHSITFKYTPDRDKVINNEPPSITSTELVRNDTVIIAPNTFDYHKYGGVKDYDIRLDKLVIDDTSVPSYNKISFKDFQIGGDYVGPIFTIYFGTTRFMMNNEQILTPISCYLNEDGKYMTDQLLKKDGFWTTELVETDMPCFLWSKTCSITLQEAYNIGEITIKYIPRKSTLSTEHDVICREIIADNALELYRSSTPNFYNPRIIDEAINESNTYYVIDFGFATNTEEFKQLPEGFRFRFIDPIFNYNYEAVKENDDWKYKYGNIHPNVNTGRFSTGNMIDFSGMFGNDVEGPCVIMNNSNEIALSYLVKHCLGHNVSGWENTWKALWNDSRATVSVDGPVELHKDQCKTSKKVEGKNQYCYMVVTNKGTATAGQKYNVTISLKIAIESVDIDLKFEYIYDWTDEFTGSHIAPYMTPTYDCYEVINFSQHGELTFEYSQRGKGLRFYASPDFLLWRTDVNYEKGTNIFRFLYDRDYVQIEPRPESCSALMTDKNIITDGIVVAQNLETHLHSLNQVANVTEETIERMKYTDAVLGEIIGNLAGLNDFVRITILTDFICLGFTGLMGIVKFGEGVMKNGLRSTLRLDDMPIISTAVRDGNRYTRIGESVTDMVQDARSMELVARDTIREEAQVINRTARDITEEAESISQRATTAARIEAERIEREAVDMIDNATHERTSRAISQQHYAETDMSLFAGGEWSAEASEMSFSSSFNIEMEANNIIHNTNRTTFGQLLTENVPLLAIDGDRTAMASSYARAAGDYILGLFNRAGQTITNGAGIVFNSANIASLVENIWWILDTYKDAIGWSVQFGGSVYKLCEFKKYSQGIEMYFTPDRFVWSVVDANNIRTEHNIVGIAKYNEMSGWNDEKLITGQALLENYYSKDEIDQMIVNHTHDEPIEITRTIIFDSINIDPSDGEYMTGKYIHKTNPNISLFLKCRPDVNTIYTYSLVPKDNSIPLTEDTIVKYVFKDRVFEIPINTEHWENENKTEFYDGPTGEYSYVTFNADDLPLSIVISYTIIQEPYASASHTHDDYASTSHTHETINNNLTVNGDVKASKVYARWSYELQRTDKVYDYGRIALDGSNENGSLEIATANENTEPIYVRQYTQKENEPFGTRINTLTLLDADGNTIVPGTLKVKDTLQFGKFAIKATNDSYGIFTNVGDETNPNDDTNWWSCIGSERCMRVYQNLDVTKNIQTNGATINGTLTVNGTDILAKITQMEAILQNHYQALLKLCEEHNMIDSDATDGSNITPTVNNE